MSDGAGVRLAMVAEEEGGPGVHGLEVGREPTLGDRVLGGPLAAGVVDGFGGRSRWGRPMAG